MILYYRKFVNIFFIKYFNILIVVFLLINYVLVINKYIFLILTKIENK